MASRMLGSVDYQDIVNGATLYGSGGGGPRWMGEEIAKQIGTTGVKLVACEDVPDDAKMAIVSFFGAPVGYKGTDCDYGQITAVAYQQLAKLVQQDFTYIVPLETGAGNSLIPLAVAAKLGLPVVDVDGARRAMPSPFCATWMSLPLTTFAAASSDTLFITAQVKDTIEALKLQGAVFVSPSPLATASGLATWAMTGAEMKAAALKGSLSDALGLGQAIRTAIASSADPVQAAVKYLNGEVLGIGTIRAKAVPDALTAGKIVFSCDHQVLTVITSSENVVVWSDQTAVPLAIAPDLISFMTTAGAPLAAFDLEDLPVGTEIAIIRSPAAPELYQPPLLQAYMQVVNSVGYMGPPPSSPYQ